MSKNSKIIATPSPVVLDGGFSTQVAQHVNFSIDGHPLWTARLLKTHPDAVLKTHLDFLRAGSDIIETNTYQATAEGFLKHLGLPTVDGYGLIRHAVQLAKQARDIYLRECRDSGVTGREILIAGSVGPYGAYLNDGSEYTGNYADSTSTEILRAWHMPRIMNLIEAGVDLLAFETIPCQKEAEVLLGIIKDLPNIKAWISFSVRDERSLSHGEDFKKVALKCWDDASDRLLSVGVNCCSPKIVSKLFKEINDERKDNPIPLITYPNSGEKYKPDVGWTEKDKCESLHSFVHEWLGLGVRYIGGCCRTTNEDISNIRKEVDSSHKYLL